MKNKIKLFITLCVTFLLLSANNLFAWVITMSGKGPNGYNYVHIDDVRKTITCNGAGTINCPVNYTMVTGSSGNQYPMQAIEDAVRTAVQNGNSAGQANYQDGITYSWIATPSTATPPNPTGGIVILNTETKSLEIIISDFTP